MVQAKLFSNSTSYFFDVNKLKEIFRLFNMELPIGEDGYEIYDEQREIKERAS